MRRHLIRWTATLIALAPVVAAQVTFSTGRATAVQADSKVRLIVMLDADAGVDMVCGMASATPVAKACATEGLYLIESVEVLPSNQAATFAQQVGELPGVVYSEVVQAVRSPEVEACGAPIGVSAQQCTIAFADGTPSEGEFLDQDPLSDLGYALAQMWWFNNDHQPSLVAIIDTGVDASHPAIASKVVQFGWDFITELPQATDMANGIDDDGDGWVDEAFGHGTHLASIVTLLNPDARILPLRVLDADGNGDSFDVADAIYYAVDHGAQVINLSLSMKTQSLAVALALEYARFADVPVFTSAGNTGKQKVLFPGNYDPDKLDFDLPFLPVGWTPSKDAVTTVASVEECNVKAQFSAWGVSVDLVAPGVDIYGAMPGGGYAWWSGTSMSTAVASGVASLVLSVAGPDLSIPPAHLLMDTAQPVDWVNQEYFGLLGEGSVDAWQASVEASKD